MKLSTVILSGALMVLAGCASQPKAPPIESVEVALPDSQAWNLVVDKVGDRGFIKEWIPENTTPETTERLITLQKLPVGNLSAKDYSQMMAQIAAIQCSDIAVNIQNPIQNSRYDTIAVRLICAQQNGKSYGTFTDQRVIMDRNSAYVITSEIRVEPTEEAGMIPFEDKADAARFLKQANHSAKFVRDAVRIVTTQPIQ